MTVPFTVSGPEDRERLMAGLGEHARTLGTMAELSSRSGMSRTHLHVLLRDSGRPRVETLLALIDLLDLQMVIAPRAMDILRDGILRDVDIARDAYAAGFADSCEGYNGDCPFDEKDPAGPEGFLTDSDWLERREDYIRQLLNKLPDVVVGDA